MSAARCFLLATVLLLGSIDVALGQNPGGGGQRPGRPTIDQPSEPIENTAREDKPEAAAKKAYAAGVKSMERAAELEPIAQQAPNPDKKARAVEKIGDAYSKALDQFTEALRNKGDMYDAWNRVGYVHLRLGAFAESIDDYNHALLLKPDLYEATLHRGEAYLAVDRLDDSQNAYLDLINHARGLADQLMLTMRKWLASHRVDAHGMSGADIDAFEQWLQARG